MSVEYDAKLVEIGRLAIEHDASRIARAAARRDLSKHRREWYVQEGHEYWGPKDRVEGDEEMLAAHNARETANATFRRTAGALLRAIRRMK